MSVATDLQDAEQVEVSILPMVKLDITNNWTGVNELPFEVIAERELEIEAESEKGPMSVRFGKPVYVGEMGWACVFQMSAMGRVHASPARGVDAVDALQAAFGMVHKQLTGMGRMHRITFGGGEDLGFSQGVVDTAPKGAGCPVMNGSMSL